MAELMNTWMDWWMDESPHGAGWHEVFDIHFPPAVRALLTEETLEKKRKEKERKGKEWCEDMNVRQERRRVHEWNEGKGNKGEGI